MWQYHTEPGEPSLDRLTQLGAEGWELCGVAHGRLYFKRVPPTLQERATQAQRERALATPEAPVHDGEALPPPIPGFRPRLLQPDLRHLLASAGHSDLIVICDRGFPIPPGLCRIDLALTDGLPTVLDVLRCAATEVTLDRLVMAEEARRTAATRLGELAAAWPSVPLEFVPHITFKSIARSARGIVRTGDVVPYANLILTLG